MECRFAGDQPGSLQPCFDPWSPVKALNPKAWLNSSAPVGAVSAIQDINIGPTSGSCDIRYRNVAWSAAVVRSEPQDSELAPGPLLVSASPYLSAMVGMMS